MTHTTKRPSDAELVKLLLESRAAIFVLGNRLVALKQPLTAAFPFSDTTTALWTAADALRAALAPLASNDRIPPKCQRCGFTMKQEWACYCVVRLVPDATSAAPV